MCLGGRRTYVQSWGAKRTHDIRSTLQSSCDESLKGYLNVGGSARLHAIEFHSTRARACQICDLWSLGTAERNALLPDPGDQNVMSDEPSKQVWVWCLKHKSAKGHALHLVSPNVAISSAVL